jgi:hypothetical protein
MLSNDDSSNTLKNRQQKQAIEFNIPDKKIRHDEASSSDAAPIKPDLMPVSEAVNDQELVNAIFDAKLMRNTKKQKWINTLRLVAVFVGGLTPPIASAMKDGAGFIPYLGNDFFTGLGRWVQKFPVLAPFLMHSSGAAMHSMLNENTYIAIVQIKKDIEAVRDSIYSDKMSEEENQRANALYGDQSTRENKIEEINVFQLPMKHRWVNHLPTLIALLLTAAIQGVSGGNEVWSLIEGDEDHNAIWRLIKSVVNFVQTAVTLLFLTSLSEKIVAKKIKPLSEIKEDFSKAFVEAQKVRLKLLLTQARKHGKDALKQSTIALKYLGDENQAQQRNILELKQECDASKLQIISKKQEVDTLRTKQSGQEKSQQAFHQEHMLLKNKHKTLSSDLDEQQSKIKDLTQKLKQSNLQNTSKQEKINKLHADQSNQKNLEKTLRQKLTLKNHKIKRLLAERETKKKSQANKTEKESSKTDLFQLRPKEPQPNQNIKNVLSN